MAQIEKPSVSGFMSQHHEISRFENLFFKRIQTAYYNRKWGLDWEFWLDPTYELPLNSFVSYMTQEAMMQGIVIEDVDASIENFTLVLRVVIEGIEFKQNQGLE